MTLGEQRELHLLSSPVNITYQANFWDQRNWSLPVSQFVFEPHPILLRNLHSGTNSWWAEGCLGLNSCLQGECPAHFSLWLLLQHFYIPSGINWRLSTHWLAVYGCKVYGRQIGWDGQKRKKWNTDLPSPPLWGLSPIRALVYFLLRKVQLHLFLLGLPHHLLLLAVTLFNLILYYFVH